MTDPTPADRLRAIALLDAADWFTREGRMVQRLFGHQVAALLRRRADDADPMVGSLARDGFGADEIAAMLRPEPAVVPPADRAAVLREAEAKAREVVANLWDGGTTQTKLDRTDGARAVELEIGQLAAQAELRAKAAEAQPATEAETDEQRADREETERDHAQGDHTYCGITCEAELPTEHLRNFVIAKGYPGTKGALAELERRAAAGARQDGAPS